MENNKQSRFRRAKNRIEQIKGFYRHLSLYVVINTVLLIGKTNVYAFFTTRGFSNQGFFDWLEWNIFLTPVLWGIGLLIHGIFVYRYKPLSIKQLKPKALKDWEENQIQKYMEKNNRTTSEY